MRSFLSAHLPRCLIVGLLFLCAACVGTPRTIGLSQDQSTAGDLLSDQGSDTDTDNRDVSQDLIPDGEPDRSPDVALPVGCNEAQYPTIPQRPEVDVCATSSGPIGDATWSADKNYLVNCPLLVESGTLTIEPGTVVLFGPDAGLSFRSGGALKASGTLEKRIQLLPAKKCVPWVGLRFDPTASGGKTVIENTDILSAGWSTAPQTLSGSVVFDQLAGYSFVSNSILDGRSVGVVMTNGAVTGIFSQNTIRSQDYPLSVHPALAGTIQPGTYASYAPEKSVIWLQDEIVTLLGPLIIADPGVPFRLNRDLTISGPTGLLSLKHGVTIEVASGVAIIIDNNAGLTAAGLSNRPIVLKSIGDAPWQGLRFLNANGSMISMTYLTVANAGLGSGNELAASILFDKTGEIDRMQFCLVDGGPMDGIAFSTGSWLKAGRFQGNTVKDKDAAPLVFALSSLRNLPTSVEQWGNFSANGDPVIAVIGESVLSNSIALTRAPMPYVALGFFDFTVGSSTQTPVSLTLMPGAQFRVNSGQTITFGPGGSLVVSAQSGVPPAVIGPDEEDNWVGLVFTSKADYAGTSVENLILDKGGMYNHEWGINATLLLLGATSAARFESILFNNFTGDSAIWIQSVTSCPLFVDLNVSLGELCKGQGNGADCCP